MTCTTPDLHRVYRDAWSHERAIKLLHDEAGTKFDQALRLSAGASARRRARSDGNRRLALPNALQRVAQRLLLVSTAANRSPCFSIRAQHDVHRERRRIELLGRPRPSEAASRPAPLPRAHGVDRRDRLPLAVLVRVDQDAAALRPRPLSRDEAPVRPGEREAMIRRTRALCRTCAGARPGRGRGCPPSRSSCGRSSARALRAPA